MRGVTTAMVTTVRMKRLKTFREESPSEGRLEVDDDFVRQPRMFNSLKDVVESAPSQNDPVSADDFDEGNLHTPENLHKI